jgi:hypothetical protein
MDLEAAMGIFDSLKGKGGSSPSPSPAPSAKNEYNASYLLITCPNCRQKSRLEDWHAASKRKHGSIWA